MAPEQFRDLRALFEAALNHAPADRTSFVDQVCKGDDIVRGELVRLLEAHVQSQVFLDKDAAAILPFADAGRVEVLELHLQPGAIFADRYHIHHEIGRGAFGVVYRAFDRGPLQRKVALKLIRLGPTANPERHALVCMRFLEEARMAGSLSHNNIATVFDFGECSGSIYMTQELAPGRDLAKIIAESGPLPVRRVIVIARQVCDGLRYAHANAIVHRDIKPANVVVDADDQVKITDFGLAQRPPEEISTRSEMAAGTPGYMPPEQLLGRTVTARADQFSVGCMLYEMLTGRPAFPGDTVGAVVDGTLHHVPLPPSAIRKDLPRTLDRVVMRAIRKDPFERYDDMGSLAHDLIHHEKFERIVDTAPAVTEITAALESRLCVLIMGQHFPAGSNEKKEHAAGG